MGHTPWVYLNGMDFSRILTPEMGSKRWGREGSFWFYREFEFFFFIIFFMENDFFFNYYYMFLLLD